MTCANKSDSFFCNLQIFNYVSDSFGRWSFQNKILKNDNCVLGSLGRESTLAGQSLHLFVELEAVVAWLGTKDATTTDEHR